MVRLGLLSRAGKKDIDKDIEALAQEFPYVMSSKTILELLTKRELLLVSSVSSWVAFQAIVFLLIEEGK